MNLAAITAAIAPAVRSSDLFESFDSIEDKAESLRHRLIVERLWPGIRINSKRIPEVPG
jgi:hypothetical protein